MTQYQPALPRIGIRPVIDGREKGIRESLEAQTMGLARRVAAFIESNLRHASGQPVECVVASGTIGGVTEAARTEEEFQRAQVMVSISVTPCWCYGTETIDMDPVRPKAIWGFNGTERPGAVYLAAAAAAHDQLGLPVFSIYGRDVQDAGDESIPPDVAQKLLTFARAAIAVTTMRGRSYLAMGGVSMGIAGSIVDPGFLQRYLGMRYEFIDMSEFARRLEEGIFDAEEYARALSWVKTRCSEGIDVNAPGQAASRATKDKEWETCVKMTLIARDLMKGNERLRALGYGEESLGHNAILGGFQGQRQWTDHFPNGDFTEAILNSSFDWNGIRQPVLLATENDSLNGVSMLFSHLLTGTAQVFADVRTYWSPEAVRRVTGQSMPEDAGDGFIHLINSGSAALDGTGQMQIAGGPALKPFWQVGQDDVDRCLASTSWRPAVREYFRGGGYSSNFRTQGGMPVTMSRVNLVHGVGPVLQIAEGRTVRLDDAMHRIIDDRTNPTWPTTWFVPRTTGHGAFRDVYSVMDNWGANHGVLSYGHVGRDLIALCSMLRIPVAMHNVDESSILRPKTWAAFGTAGLEAADYRACAALGPLYGR